MDNKLKVTTMLSIGRQRQIKTLLETAEIENDPNKLSKIKHLIIGLSKSEIQLQAKEQQTQVGDQNVG